MPVSNEASEMAISKSKKVVAITQGFAIVLVVGVLLLSSLITIGIVLQQDAIADRLLDCTIPTGACYQEKVGDSQLKNAVTLLSIVEYCSNIHPDSVPNMETCINKEVSER